MKSKQLFYLLPVLGVLLALTALFSGPAKPAAAQGPLPDTLVLWNKLGSQTEIENSAVGLGGAFNGGSFVEGVVGQAYSARYDQDFLISFPKEVIPDQAGAIEFWAKLTNLPHGIGYGRHVPHFIDIQDGYSRFYIGLNGNDGAGGGGLVGYAGHGFTTGTGYEGSWTYEQVLGFGQKETWHHYALVWDANGIAGVADGTKKVAVFLDGQLESGRWYDYFGADSEFVSLTGGELAAVENAAAQGSVAIDNLKIWNYAKTDFIKLVVTPNGADIYPGDPVSVDLAVQDADSLYGLQATCTVDPAILAPQSGAFGDFFANPLIGANTVDAGTGAWFGGLSLQSPATPRSGDGLLATLSYTALAPGTTGLACTPLFSNRDGFELSGASPGEVVTVLAFGSISGAATYQGRLDQAGIEITMTGPANGSASTDSAGQFTFDQLKAGNYIVRADAPLYLPNCITETVASGQNTALSPTVLTGGDTNDNDIIGIGDATLVGSHFGQLVPPADPAADINGDGVVNIQDLALLGGNFGRENCQPW